MCSVGTAGVGVARFQNLGDGGHVEFTWREEWILWLEGGEDEARRLDGEENGMESGVWPGRD